MFDETGHGSDDVGSGPETSAEVKSDKEDVEEFFNNALERVKGTDRIESMVGRVNGKDWEPLKQKIMAKTGIDILSEPEYYSGSTGHTLTEHYPIIRSVLENLGIDFNDPDNKVEEKIVAETPHTDSTHGDIVLKTSTPGIYYYGLSVKEQGGNLRGISIVGYSCFLFVDPNKQVDPKKLLSEGKWKSRQAQNPRT